MDEASIYAGFFTLTKPTITAEWVRENFPGCSQIADEFRELFGEGVRMAACEENGRQLGKFTDPKDYQGVRSRELFFLGLDKDGNPMPKVMLAIIGVANDGK